MVNAVCPLVTKVHHELKTRAGRGYTILYAGHEGHEEAVGTMAVAPGSVRLVETEGDVGVLADPGTPVALLAQTTLSHDEWSGVREAVKRRFPDVWMPGKSDLCFATTNRQAALRVVAAKADAVVVIGSANSSNTVALTKVAAAVGALRVVRVDDPSELPDDLSGTVAVTAGASAPEALVEAVLRRLSPSNGIEEVLALTEDEYFPPPRELRDLVRVVGALVALAVGGPVPDPAVLAVDRLFQAADVLDELGGAA
jgi:4-hydroxy-3-methylbut-2-enyl diphosphate reductase